MAILKIRLYPDSILRKKALVVTEFTEEDKKLIKDMIETMYAFEGVGLAAPQVGVSKRIFVANPSGERGKEWVIINPRILKKSGSEILTEGCLSLPGISAEVKRYKRLVLKYEDLSGEEKVVSLEGLLARIVQHETDHLEGVLFIDRIGVLKRFKLLWKFKNTRI
ncbi:MAG: peptide deformylase [Candidatus Omnitrophica bacterium]|nr:peptide deformylase [Candidatus Omnitrophota bacterium]MCM8793283.1 peptide deformylase [Candidatus Omnitrophota bacterium]